MKRTDGAVIRAFTGFETTVENLDKKKFRVPIREIVTPGYRKVISGQGFPIKGDWNSRGDLILAFEIVFPTYLSEEKKKRVREALKN